MSRDLDEEPVSGRYPVIDRQTAVTSRLGEIVALVAVAFALGGVVVRYEGHKDWAKERIARLEAKDEARSKSETDNALRLQRIEDALMRIELKLRRDTRDGR